jgi:NADPH:quinone reductase-like Zn-dependent oxidoreductase
MKAFILDRYGSADGVRIGDVPDPEPREDDVLVQVHAAGVNLLDSKIRNGEFTRIEVKRYLKSLGAKSFKARRQLSHSCAVSGDSK